MFLTFVGKRQPFSSNETDFFEKIYKEIILQQKKEKKNNDI